MSSTQLSVMHCYLVNSIPDPFEQCKFLIDNECLEDESFIDYVYLIYCRIGYDFRLLTLMLIIFLVILLFLAISAIADDFLCISLLTVSRNLRMSDSLAGITLLAFGNGCPDIFSSIAAAYDSRSEMIIAELLGAGIFCTSVVSGLVFINSDFKLARRPILRDTSFYMLAVYLIWCYSLNGKITFYAALTFIIIYLVYLTVALCGQVISSRLRKNYPLEQHAKLAAGSESQLMGCDFLEKNGTWFAIREDSLTNKRRSSNDQTKQASQALQLGRPIIRVDYREGVTSVHLNSSEVCQQQTQVNKSIASLEVQLFSSLKTAAHQTGSGDTQTSGGRRGFTNHAFVVEDGPSAATNEQHDLGKSNLGTPTTMLVSCPAPKHQLHSSTTDNPKLHLYEQPACPAIVASNRIPSQVPGATPGKNKATATATAADMCLLEGGGDDDRAWNEWDSFFAHINPIETTDWRTISLTAKIIRILRAPVVLVAHLTIPIVDNQKILNNWCRPLNALHFITVPLFIMLAMGHGQGLKDGASGPDSARFSLSGLLGVPTPVAELVLATLLAAYLLFHLTSPHQAPKYHAAFAYVGFGMSVFWVYLLATEMISLMKTFGLVFGMSDTAIGLGILAWGNSLGDIVANYSLTKANYPRMALGACIGAPLLNLLLGFGLSFTISLKPGQFSPIQYSPTITLLCSTLIIILLSIMLTTLFLPNASKRLIGYLLIICYLVYFMVAVCLEYKLINF